MLNGTVKVLNDLIETSEDGEEGFSEAAKGATRPELKTIFLAGSADRRAAVIELRALLHSLGGTHVETGTVVGSAHRGWARVKATVGDANIDMLEEMERAGNKATAMYVSALTGNLSLQIRNVLQRQHDGAVRYQDTIRDLRDNYKAIKEAVGN
jgi:uncharacterized protein (TIGR02284 family)